jgi:hypothetical protein
VHAEFPSLACRSCKCRRDNAVAAGGSAREPKLYFAGKNTPNLHAIAVDSLVLVLLPHADQGELTDATSRANKVDRRGSQ